MINMVDLNRDIATFETGWRNIRVIEIDEKYWTELYNRFMPDVQNWAYVDWPPPKNKRWMMLFGKYWICKDDIL